MTREEREKLRALYAEATSGTWGSNNHRVFVTNPDGTPASGGLRVGMWPHVANVSREVDAEFIAAARCALPALLDALDEAEARKELVGEVLAAQGCDCECGHDSEGHNDECDRCLGCRVEVALFGVKGRAK